MGINFDQLILPVPKMDDYIVWCGQWYSMMTGYITCFSQGGQKHTPPISPPSISSARIARRRQIPIQRQRHLLGCLGIDLL